MTTGIELVGYKAEYVDDIQDTTVANEFGSDMLRRFGGLQSPLSPPAHVLSSSPHSQDSIEW